MKTLQALLLTGILAVGLGCGYSRKSTMPGVMPSIMQLTPPAVSAGSGSFSLTVTGTNFASNAVINWNNRAMSGTQYVSSTQLMITVPAANIANSGTATVSVTNPGTNQYGGTMSVTSANVDFMIN